jgi:hypothetical protein
MPGIEKAAGGAARAMATYEADVASTESVASTKEPSVSSAKPPADVATQDVVKTVKGAEAEREVAKYRRLVDAQKKDAPSAKDVGMCKTLVSSGVALASTIATGFATKNPYAMAGAAAAGKALGDGVAFELCDPEAGK